MELQLAANLALALAFNAIMGGTPAAGGFAATAAGGGGGGLTTLVGGIPRFAGGGPLRAGQPALVGERGVELFVPEVAGHVLSHPQLMKLRWLQSGTLPGAILPPEPGRTSTGQAAGQGGGQVVQIIDQRGKHEPAIEVSQQTGADGRQITVAIVRSGLSEMQRSGELGQFFRKGYNVKAAPR
jgi:hypothetical protein